METENKLYSLDEYLGQLNVAPQIIQALESQGEELTVTCEGKLIQTDESFICEHCEECHEEDCSTSVYSGGRASEPSSWCEVCQNECAFYCERGNEYFSDESYTCVQVDGEYICLEWHEDELWLWDSDGEYHWQSEEDSEESEGGRIPQYHNAPRPWVGLTIPPLALGVELECWSSDRYKTYSRARDLGLTGEQDGSLDSSHGIEIIGPPKTLDWYNDSNNGWRLFCDQSSVRCWDAEGNYGQHVSINVKDEGQLAIAKAIVFVHHNRTLCELIAGRGANTYNVYKDVKVTSAARESRDKYCATNWNTSQGRLEFRIFRANRRWDGFVRNVEFTHAVFSFAQQESNRGLNSINFVNYVNSNPLRLKGGSYPHLTSFLDDDCQDNERYWASHRKGGK